MLVPSLLVAAALAQDSNVENPSEMNVQTYRLPIDAQHTMWTDDSTFAGDNYVQARLGVGYVKDPFIFEYDDTGEKVRIVGDALSFDLTAAYSIKRVRLGVDIPVYAMANGDQASGAGLGDIALDIKATALDRNDDDPVGLAFLTRVSVPSGAGLAVPMGGAFAWDLEAIVDQIVAEKVQLGANVGVRVQPKTELSNVSIGTKLLVRGGAAYLVSDNAGVSLDLNGFIDMVNPGNAQSLPVEAMLGGYGRAGDSDIVIRGGVGTGLTPGIGAPVFRGILAIAYEPPLSKDTDLDGISDDDDGCPMDPEDVDQWEDENGCPDLDNDKDGIADLQDTCRDVAEDLDGWQDQDGCPDPNTQVHVKIIDRVSGVALPNVVAKVTNGSATSDGDQDFTFEGPAGQWTLTASVAGYKPLEVKFDIKDGPPVELQYPMEKDVVPGIVRVRVTDPAGNAIPNATLAINDAEPKPMDAGQFQESLPPGGYVVMVRAEGFAPSSFPVTIKESATGSYNVVLQPAKVAITKEKLDIKDKIFFETGKAIIKKESFPLLDEVANILLDHPELQLMRIEGHTDSRGDDASNMKLSQARADSVRQYLVDKGVEPARLTSIGFGETRPVDPAANTVAYDKNRRVEFYIEKRAE